MPATVVGIYEVGAEDGSAVDLIELHVSDCKGEVRVEQFFQNLRGADREVNIAHQMHVLSPKGDQGTEVIHDSFSVPNDARLAFFLHDLDSRVPLDTPFGRLALSAPQSHMPERLRFIRYYHD